MAKMFSGVVYSRKGEMIMKHTKGPLDIKPDNHTVQQCCICYGGSSMKEALECHLSILKKKYPELTAAAELLEACKSMLHIFDRGLNWDTIGRRICDEARAAIEKARGGTT